MLFMLIVPSLAWAEGFPGDMIDFDLLMRENADQVVVTTDGLGRPIRRLELGDGQRIECSDTECSGYDLHNATGCTWKWLSYWRATVEFCEFPKSAATEALEKVQSRYANHIAENAVPPRSNDEIEIRYLLMLEEFLDSDSDAVAEICSDANYSSGEIAAVLALFSDPEAMAVVEATLATPRLPMFEPCL
jgi:hypothetical protein